MKKEKLAAGSRILFLLPLALIVIFFECVPLVGMVLKSITGHGTLTMEYFHQILEKSDIYIFRDSSGDCFYHCPGNLRCLCAYGKAGGN